MPKLIKYFSLPVLLLFVLACNAITRPFNQAQELAQTAQSLATSMPVETLRALGTQVATQIPVGTFESLPSLVPSLEAIGTGLPDFEGFFNPQGTPVSEWNGIPIMSQATTGQEFPETNTYSFKADATVKEAQDFYNAELEKLGWSTFFNMPADANGSVQVFQKEDSVLTITIAETDGTVLVILTMA